MLMQAPQPQLTTVPPSMPVASKSTNAATALSTKEVPHAASEVPTTTVPGSGNVPAEKSMQQRSVPSVEKVHDAQAVPTRTALGRGHVAAENCTQQSSVPLVEEPQDASAVPSNMAPGAGNVPAEIAMHQSNVPLVEEPQDASAVPSNMAPGAGNVPAEIAMQQSNVPLVEEPQDASAVPSNMAPGAGNVPAEIAMQQSSAPLVEEPQDASAVPSNMASDAGNVLAEIAMQQSSVPLMEKTDSLPTQDANDKVQIWLSTSDSSAHHQTAESSSINSGYVPGTAPMNPLDAVYAALRAARNSRSVAPGLTNGAITTHAAGEGEPSHRASLSDDDSLHNGRSTHAHALASAAPAHTQAGGVDMVNIVSTASNTWDQVASTRLGDEGMRPLNGALRQTPDCLSPENSSARATDIPFGANPPSLSARSTSGMVNPEAMRNYISKVLFSDVENGSTSTAHSDDDASLVSMRQTPLRLHQGLAPKEYIGAPKPSNEVDRMDFLCGLKVLGTAPEKRYNRLTSTVAKVGFQRKLLGFQKIGGRSPHYRFLSI
jgi:hypothetical protein